MYRSSLTLIALLVFMPRGLGKEGDCPEVNSLDAEVRVSFLDCPDYPVHGFVPWPICPQPTPAPPLASGGASAGAMLYAQPTPAPPSNEPVSSQLSGPSASVSPAQTGPRVSENSNYYDSYGIAPRKNEAPTGDRCALTIWNLSGNDLKLKVDDQWQALARGKKLTLTAARKFVWQIEGRDPQTERIATGEAGIEIVIRR